LKILKWSFEPIHCKTRDGLGKEALEQGKGRILEERRQADRGR
jgi:hypothetical protein